MKKIVLSLIIIFLVSCSSSSTVSKEPVADATYGYSKDNPIKVGGVLNGPIYEKEYLNSLTGPNGEKVWFKRNGSCCEFQSKNSEFGFGMLDIYSVVYEGSKDTVVLYLNMYEKSKLKAPVGFKMR
ncbi:MAG TPA: 2-dehydro-3-deoxyphosphooctonate aldolase [Flavobacterium lutivivi]|nr:2-dehydro-3-deoxyphosphooctonate aldolase [Flavobacterium lutivivi]